MKYSQSTGLIYNPKLNYASGIPFDAIDISRDELNDLTRVKITALELAQIAQSEMIAELNWCDLQIKLHASSDKRAVSKLDDIYAYARACRDYVQNIDGELTIMTDKPVRPS